MQVRKIRTQLLKSCQGTIVATINNFSEEVRAKLLNFLVNCD